MFFVYHISGWYKQKKEAVQNEQPLLKASNKILLNKET
jgi:hypothetical protein